MALMEFRWQYCHSKFIIKLQDVISTSHCIKLLWDTSICRPKSCHDEINGSILNGAVWSVLMYMECTNIYQKFRQVYSALSSIYQKEYLWWDFFPLPTLLQWILNFTYFLIPIFWVSASFGNQKISREN